MSLFRRPKTETRMMSATEAFAMGLDQRARDSSSLVPLFAAHRVIIDAVAATPLHRYRDQPDGSKVRLPSTDLFRDRDRTAFSFKARCVASLLYDGNAFGYITSRDATGWPSGMVWLDPRRTKVEDRDGVPAYFFDDRRLSLDEVVHVPWITEPGKHRGISPLAAFKSAFETGVAAQRTAYDWFENGAIPSVHVRNTEMTIDPAQSDALKQRYKASVHGRDVLLTGSDWEITTIGVPADQAQFIETMKLTATQVATIYGVPPEEIGGETGNSLTYKTLEQTELRFNARVVRPWATRIEEHLTAQLPRGQYARFNLDANVRADLMSRSQAHAINLGTGVITLDEARLLEDRAPLTPAQRQRWTEDYGKQPAPAGDPATTPKGGDDDD